MNIDLNTRNKYSHYGIYEYVSALKIEMISLETISFLYLLVYNISEVML
jgi:hypothetical protein